MTFEKPQILELAAYMPNNELLSAVSEIITGNDREELMVRWEEEQPQ